MCVHGNKKILIIVGRIFSHTEDHNLIKMINSSHLSLKETYHINYVLNVNNIKI